MSTLLRWPLCCLVLRWPTAGVRWIPWGSEWVGSAALAMIMMVKWVELGLGVAVALVMIMMAKWVDKALVLPWSCRCLGDDNDGEVSEQGSSYVQLLVTCRTRSLNSSWGQWLFVVVFWFLFLVIKFKMPPPHVALIDAGVNTAIVCISTVHLYFWNCNVHKWWCAFIISFTVICGFDKLNELWAISFICLLGKQHSCIGLDVWVEDPWRTLWMSYYKNTWNGVCEDFFIAMELILFRRSVCTERTDECHFITHEKP